MPHTWIEIDTKAIKHNLAQFRKLLGKNKLLMPVVKANAYGHGIFEIAKICDQDRGVDRICVVNDDEAQLLLESGIKKPIMILSFYDLTDELTVYWGPFWKGMEEDEQLKILIRMDMFAQGLLEIYRSRGYITAEYPFDPPDQD